MQGDERPVFKLKFLISHAQDPNRASAIGEMGASEVTEVDRFIASEKMQAVVAHVNEMSTAPMEFVWIDDVTPGWRLGKRSLLHPKPALFSA